jgi:hypothetical protein
MEQDPASEADKTSHTQEMPCAVQNQSFKYRGQNGLL